MKILFISNKYDYGKPELGLSYEYSSFCKSLERMNNSQHKVLFFPLDEIIKKKGIKKLNEELLDIVFKQRPDLVFVSTGGGAIEREVIKKISQQKGITILNWFMDDHWKFYNYSRHWGPLYNWITTTDPLVIEKYRKIGYQNALFNPQACNVFLYKPLNLPKVYDITFIGRPHGNRKEIINKLKKKGIKVKCFGEGWPNGHISQEEMIKIFSQSKINLNFTRSSGVLWKQIGLIFLYRKFDRSLGLNSPLKWYENFQVLLAQKRKQIKGRIFEIAGCGGFLLTEYTERIEDFYKIGEEIECFYNFGELIEKINYYLTHDKERESIAKAGYERTIRDHTYEKRFNHIFKQIGLIK